MLLIKLILVVLQSSSWTGQLYVCGQSTTGPGKARELEENTCSSTSVSSELRKLENSHRTHLEQMEERLQNEIRQIQDEVRENQRNIIESISAQLKTITCSSGHHDGGSAVGANWTSSEITATNCTSSILLVNSKCIHVIKVIINYEA